MTRLRPVRKKASFFVGSSLLAGTSLVFARALPFSSSRRVNRRALVIGRSSISRFHMLDLVEWPTPHRRATFKWPSTFFAVLHLYFRLQTFRLLCTSSRSPRPDVYTDCDSPMDLVRNSFVVFARARARLADIEKKPEDVR